MIFTHLSKIDLKDNWLNGRLYHLVNSSNISKLLSLLTKQLNYLVDYINRLYPSVYPCLGIELLKEHASELGLPDDIFRNDTSYYMFPYTLPLHFKSGVSNRVYISIDILRKDIICKKYLMQDNSNLGIRRIGALYNVCIEIEESQSKIIGGGSLGTASNNQSLTRIRFPYKLPLYFGKGIKNEWANRLKQVNANGDIVIYTTKITFHKCDDFTFYKLREVFRHMQPLTTNITFERLTTISTCDLSSLQICDYLK